MQSTCDPYASGYQFRGFTIPMYILEVLKRYIEYGHQPGDFLTAVLCNDLRAAVGQADDHNIVNLKAYIGFLYQEAPPLCWGSKERMRSWIEQKKEEHYVY